MSYLADFNYSMDSWCRYYERKRGINAANAYGQGIPGDTNLAAGALLDLQTYVTGCGDSSRQAALQSILRERIAYKSAITEAKIDLMPLWVREVGLITLQAIAGVSSVELFLAYQNTGAGGPWAALAPPQWCDLYYAWKIARPHPSNLYFEILQGGSFRGTTYTNALGKFVVSGAGAGAFTDGAAVDSSKYAGGIGYINMAGLAGSGNVTITGVGFNPATRAVTASVTWIVAVAGNGLTAVVPGAGTAPANCLLVDVTNITIAAGITAGTFYIEAHKPAGRLAVPW